MFFRHLMCALIVCCVLTLSLPDAQGQQTDSLGFLKIETDSLRVHILLNQKSLGYTPLPVIAIPAGKYQITACHPNPYVWGNLDWQDSILVVANDTLTIRPHFKSIVTIRTVPFDAGVYLNGELLGYTPLAIPLNSTSNQLLSIKKDGFQEQLIRLSELKDHSLLLHLVRNQTNWELAQASYRHQRLMKKYYRTISYGLWGLSIITGLSTVYFKDRADDYYQQYLVSGSLQLMNRNYNNARRYDRYTYISLAALQACFGLSFYFLLKSLD